MQGLRFRFRVYAVLMELVVEVSFSKVRCSRLEFSAFEELSFWAYTHAHARTHTHIET